MRNLATKVLSTLCICTIANAGKDLSTYETEGYTNIIQTAAYASSAAYKGRSESLDWLASHSWCPTTEITKTVERTYVDDDGVVTRTTKEKEIEVGYFKLENGPVKIWSFRGSNLSDLPRGSRSELAPVSGLNADIDGFMHRGRTRVDDAAFHRGYGKAFNKFAREVTIGIRDSDAGDMHIFVGHSMGGAFAQIAALQAGAVQTAEQSRYENLSAITFGSARPFNAGAARKFDALLPGTCYARVEDRCDPVPQLWSDTHVSGTGVGFMVDGYPESTTPGEFVDAAVEGNFGSFHPEDAAAGVFYGGGAVGEITTKAHSIDGNYIPQSAGLGFSGGGSAGGAAAASASSAGH